MKTVLYALEQQSIFILREAYAQIRPLAMLWSIGKDSCVLAHLCKKAFFGHIPFPLLHLDTGEEFAEVYQFRDEKVKEWNLPLRIIPTPGVEATDASLPPNARLAARKTLGLEAAIKENNYSGIITGIRRDEQATRAKERFFSPRGANGTWEMKNQPPEWFGQFQFQPPEGGHMRIQPLLAWTEQDIWAYIAQEKIEVVPLYFAKKRRALPVLGRKIHHLPHCKHCRFGGKHYRRAGIYD